MISMEDYLVKFQPRMREMISTSKRVDFIDALHAFAEELSHVPLSELVADPTQARKDSGRDNIVLNGVQFVGARQTPMLTSALAAVAQSAGVSSEEAAAITERVLCSCSRSCSGADSYFVLYQLLDLDRQPSLLIKPRSGEDMPVRIDMTAGAGGAVVVTVESKNLYGLYRTADIEEWVRVADGAEAMEPWIFINTVVTEQLHFGGRPWFSAERWLAISTPENNPTVCADLEECF